MLNISGFLDKSEINILDTKNDLQINSCGHYKLLRLNHLETIRPCGRIDFQIIYMVHGQAPFTLNGEKRYIPEGNIVVYFPDTPQKYGYDLKDTPEVYWVHFTGNRAQEILKSCGFSETGVFHVGVKAEYIFLFNKMIEELQLQRAQFSRLNGLYLQELLTLMARQIAQSGLPLPREEIQSAVQYFNQNYQSEISIKDYSKSCGMSVAWFIRSFKEHMGVTPQKYITGIRISKAKDLLQIPSLNISEVASLTGYQNPLYFSRIFKQSTGLSPLEYKKRKTYRTP